MGWVHSGHSPAAIARLVWWPCSYSFLSLQYNSKTLAGQQQTSTQQRKTGTYAASNATVLYYCHRRTGCSVGFILSVDELAAVEMPAAVHSICTLDHRGMLCSSTSSSITYKSCCYAGQRSSGRPSLQCRGSNNSCWLQRTAPKRHI
jgi:hypothetical protein